MGFLRTAESRRAAAAVLLLLALAAALRFFQLGVADLTEDEELSTGLPLLSYAELFYDIAGRPPLAFLAQKAVTDLSGSASAWWLRLVSVLEGLAALPLLFYLVRRQFGFGPACIAGLLLATSEFHVLYSRDARYYPLLMLVCLAALACYWAVFAEQRWRWIPALALSIAAVPLTHYAGYLFLASLVLASVPLLCTPRWLVLLRQYPHRIAGIAAGGLVAALLLGFLMRGYLIAVTRHLSWPDLTAPLPPLFDVTPEFLSNRFAEVIGVPSPWHWVVAALCLLGLLRAAYADWRWLPVSLSIVVVPFLLYYLFPPEHPWNPKYFIFQLPVFWASAALGIDLMARAIMRLGQPAYYLAAAILALGLVVPNLAGLMHDFEYPDTAQHELGRDLTAWTTSQDQYFVTWEGQPRILRHDFPPIEWPTHQQLIRQNQPFPWSLEPSPRWYLLPGKLDVNADTVREILSAKFSRIAYDEVFLARSPNIQSVSFGENAFGSPDVAGPLQLPPGGEYRFTALIPREGSRAVLADFSGDCVSLSVTVWGSTALQTDCVAAAGGVLEKLGEVPLKRGPVEIQLQNTGPAPLALNRLHLVPVFAGDGPLSLPAWDFLAFDGGDNLSSVWVQQRDDGLMLRDFRHGQSATYVFYSEYEGPITLEAAALNDPPFINRYQVVMPGTKLDYAILEFAREDGTVSRERTKPFALGRGLYSVSIGYLGVPSEDMKRATRNGRARTEETLQNSGLKELVLLPGGEAR